MRRPPYYNGKVHVRATMCETCIFRPGNLMQLHPGRVAGMVRDARAKDSCIPCHGTTYEQAPQEAVCRGFYDKHPTIPLRLARSNGHHRGDLGTLLAPRCLSVGADLPLSGHEPLQGGCTRSGSCSSATPTYPYLVLLNSHDGSAACKVVNTSVRVVCWNTFQAAFMEGEKSGRQFTFRHTKKVLSRIEDARAALQGLKAEQRQWIELATELSLLPISGVQFNHFLSEFIPEPEAGVVSDRVLANVDKAREISKSLYFDSPTTEGIRGRDELRRQPSPGYGRPSEQVSERLPRYGPSWMES